MRYRIALLALFVSFSSYAQSDQKLPTIDDARKLTDAVMAKVGAGELESGLRLAKPYLIIPEAEFEALVGQAKLQLPAMTQRFSKSVDTEFISEEKVGTHLVRIVQLQLLEKHVNRWIFYFYKTSGGWVLNSFNFDDKIQLMFCGAS